MTAMTPTDLIANIYSVLTKVTALELLSFNESLLCAQHWPLEFFCLILTYSYEVDAEDSSCVV